MPRYSAAPGERGGMPPAIAARLLEIGPGIEPAATAEIYAPVHAAAHDAGHGIIRDCAYGPHERNILDVLSPDDGAGRRPVLAFVHGGGFTRGAKNLPGLPFYDNILRWAAGNGLVGVTVNYRLAPDHVWPSGIEDLTAVSEWIQGNIRNFGGDPSRVYFWGHSAGAAHVGDYIADREGSEAPTGLAGAILTSGFYDLGTAESAWSVYYGADVSQYARRSSLPGLASASLPILVNDADLDPEPFRLQAEALTAARRAAGTPVDYLRLRGHSHISETYAVGTEDTTLSAEVRRFIGH